LADTQSKKKTWDECAVLTAAHGCSLLQIVRRDARRTGDAMPEVRDVQKYERRKALVVSLIHHQLRRPHAGKMTSCIRHEQGPI